MNVLTVLPRLLVSSRCPHSVRFLLEESLSSSIRHNSTNAAVLNKPSAHYSDLVKEALASKTDTQDSAPPRLHTTAPSKPIKKTKSIRRRAKRSKEKEELKSASKNNIDSKKTQKKKPSKLPEAGLRDIKRLESQLLEFPKEKWESEPWWSSQQTDDQHQPEDADRSSPPHLLQQVIISEGTLNPSETSNLVDVPAVVEHLPVARLCHGLERVLFKYVIFLWLDFLMIDRFAAPVFIGYETRIRGCITSLRG